MSYQSLFQVKQSSTNCRSLTMTVMGDFRQEARLDYPGQDRSYPALCKVSNKHVYLIGGHIGRGNILNTCLRYDNAQNEWAFVPSLQIARNACSSCAVQTNLYVFCGHNSGGHLNSIERLSLVENAAE